MKKFLVVMGLLLLAGVLWRWNGAEVEATPDVGPGPEAPDGRGDEDGLAGRGGRDAQEDRIDYSTHVAALKLRLEGESFHIVVQPPFVIVGDELPDVVERRARNTVKWAVDRLKDMFFENDPPQTIDIWLFKDESSYRQHAKKFFGDEPDTPYGYYSETHRALVMNIATGGGTLVHEIVHPFVHANFPEAPAWFNEGLGSLYEQCGEREGRIMGATNWRLAGLQRAIRAGHLPSFRTLTSTTAHQFYQLDPGTNYAQSRYLCYYLQEQGLLADYYRAFVAARSSDPTGYETLKQVLTVGDMNAFQKVWESWVLGLSFP